MSAIHLQLLRTDIAASGQYCIASDAARSVLRTALLHPPHGALQVAALDAQLGEAEFALAEATAARSTERCASAWLFNAYGMILHDLLQCVAGWQHTS